MAARLADWAAHEPEGAALSVALKPPSERTALADQAQVEAWVRGWRSLGLPVGATVDWETRSWKRIGQQEVPVRLRLDGPGAVAAFGGGVPRRDWTLLVERVAHLRENLGASPELDAAVRRHRTQLVGWDDHAFRQVVEVTRWLVATSVRGLRPRQVPVRGVDTKWFASHRSIVTDLHAAATGSRDLGLVEADRLMRLRILDPALAIGGLRDLAVPAAELATASMRPCLVFVFENLESVLAMPDWPRAVALHGSGYAVDAVAGLPWVADSRVIYWGDLDSHGFAILNRLRAHVPHATTTLMDEDTLLAHRDLWVQEPAPTRAELPTLTAMERRALDCLRAEGDVRLEQERIPWSTALAGLEDAAH
ncbi:Wadjet anti-phage system protein JetD domain-containing protein [Nocardioides zeae]|uniref:Wadjet anti-phage system protein JetD domain-containing protein n=1 Tax=Nocardioides zeae TaxID=1457234 RepID=UPI0027D7A87F|nr:Wadjet anti-phage system protein JetD domain-containing protein [Nocardioides zeae]